MRDDNAHVIIVNTPINIEIVHFILNYTLVIPLMIALLLPQ